LKSLIFRSLGLEKLKHKVAWLSSAQLRLDICWLIVMESSLARLGSGSSRNFLLLLEKLEPKNQQSLIGSTEKNSGLKSLIF
jgi:hypothetical protein